MPWDAEDLHTEPKAIAQGEAMPLDAAQEIAPQLTRMEWFVDTRPTRDGSTLTGGNLSSALRYFIPQNAADNAEHRSAGKAGICCVRNTRGKVIKTRERHRSGE